MKKLLLISCFISLALLLNFYEIAKADLVLIDDLVFGEQSILRDTDSGLDWLKITESTTLGKTFSSIFWNLSSEEYTGFRFATQAELIQLIISSGYDGTDDYSFADYIALNNVIYSLGPSNTITSGEFPDTIYSWAYLNGMLEPTIQTFEDFGGILGATAYLYMIPIGELTIMSSFSSSTGGFGYFGDYDFGFTSYLSFPGYSDSTDDPYRGAFLVRTTPGAVAPVPEPATVLLLISGLIGLEGLRRKLKKDRS